jgi:hypothetical protein
MKAAAAFVLAITATVFGQPGTPPPIDPARVEQLANPSVLAGLMERSAPEDPEDLVRWFQAWNNLDIHQPFGGDDTPKNEPTEGHRIAGCVQVPLEPPLDTESLRAENPWPRDLIDDRFYVPFEFDSNVTQTNRNRAAAAMAEIEGFSRVRFIGRSDFDGAWIRFVNSDSNNAPIGHDNFNRRPGIVNIQNWDFNYVIVHELFHVLGVFHEQSRPDRNAFVTVNLSNVQAGRENNFQIQNNSRRFGYYDFLSIMHYPTNAFAIDPDVPTITVNPPWDTRFSTLIGNTTFITELDKTTIACFYKPGWVMFAGPPNGPNTGDFDSPFADPRDAINAAPVGGKIVFKGTNYGAFGVFNKPQLWTAPDGPALIRP